MAEKGLGIWHEYRVTNVTNARQSSRRTRLDSLRGALGAENLRKKKSDCTMVQNENESRHKYWATHSSIRSFTRTTHFQAHVKVKDSMSQQQAVLNHRLIACLSQLLIPNYSVYLIIPHQQTTAFSSLLCRSVGSDAWISCWDRAIESSFGNWCKSRRRLRAAIELQSPKRGSSPIEPESKGAKSSDKKILRVRIFNLFIFHPSS